MNGALEGAKMDGIQSKSESAREREREREKRVDREKQREVKQQRVGSNVAISWSGGFDRWPWRKPSDRV